MSRSGRCRLGLARTRCPVECPPGAPASAQRIGERRVRSMTGCHRWKQILQEERRQFRTTRKSGLRITRAGHTCAIFSAVRRAVGERSPADGPPPAPCRQKVPASVRPGRLSALSATERMRLGASCESPDSFPVEPSRSQPRSMGADDAKRGAGSAGAMAGRPRSCPRVSGDHPAGRAATTGDIP